MAAYSQHDSSKVELSRIIQDINNGYRVLIVMRGLPGSGKSTLAKSVIQATVSNSKLTHILSTDDYFKMTNGRYAYDVAKLSDAHSWNQRRANQYLSEGVSPIVIDNTNLELWEMKPYAASAIENGYIIKILEPKTPWAQKPAELARRNSHGVPILRIKRMLEKYHTNVTVDFFLKYFEFEYSPQRRPPIKRNAPEIIHKKPPDMNYLLSQHTNMNGSPPANAKITNGVDLNHFEVKNNSAKLSFKLSHDLIDLSDPDDQAISEPVQNVNCNGFNGAESGKTVKISSNNYESCSDIWAHNNDSNDKSQRPKPQRNMLKGFAKTLDKSKNSISVNWEPIDESISSWDNSESYTNGGLNKFSQILIDSCEPSTNTGSRFLPTDNGEINSSNVSMPLNSKLTSENDTMTFSEHAELEQDIERTRHQSISELKVLFENIPEKYLFEVLDTCNGDVNWAVEILLDGKNNENFIDLPECTPKTVESENINQEKVVVASNSSESSEIKSNKRISNNDTRSFKSQTKLRKDKSSSEVSTELKKQIEDSFQFSNDHYSEHYLKLKKRDVVDLTSQNDEVDLKTSSENADPSNSESSDEAEPPEKTVSFRMGRDFFEQLDLVYGTNSSWDHNLEPIIHLPTSLLNQIHALWLESVCNQMEVQRDYMQVMLKEDEELARELEAKEYQQESEGQEPGVANIEELMEMELALAQYNNNKPISQWNQAPEDLATKLTQQKLCQMFPEIEEETLMEIYKAHANNFEQTFHVLLLSTGKISQSQTEGIDENAFKKLLTDMERDLLERANREKEKPLAPDLFDEEDVINIQGDDGNETIIDNKLAVQYFRQQAQYHLKIRNENFNKAKIYIGRGMMQVASYFSNLAMLHKKKHDHANNLAASRLMQVSASGTDSFTLDLHSLFVAEALQVLDMFLDKHISELRESANTRILNSKLFLITGRGRHSPGNQPRIKPAAIRRLIERSLAFYEINPGLLGVCISSDSVLASGSSNMS